MGIAARFQVAAGNLYILILAGVDAADQKKVAVKRQSAPVLLVALPCYFLLSMVDGLLNSSSVYCRGSWWYLSDLAACQQVR